MRSGARPSASSSYPATPRAAMTAFSWKTTYYPSRLEYQQALLPFKKPDWIQRVTIHHTWRPTVAEWRGKRTMDVLERFYRSKGWPGGPHLFLAPDGIWAGTPLADPGVHAGMCNVDSIGVEIVGDYDQQPWDVGLRERVYDLIVLLLHWIRTTEQSVTGHRECLPNKTCPGSAIIMPHVRRELRNRLFDRHFVVTVPGARVRARPDTTAPILQTLLDGTVMPAHLVRGGAFSRSTDWARVKLPTGTIGYVFAGLGRWEMI